jgi:hypothetical protein
MATTSDAAAPAISAPLEVITKPVDFDQLKERLRQLPAAAD